MTHRSKVVPETSGVEEDDFRNAMISGLARAQRRVGAKALAFIMDLTPKGLGNLFSGRTARPDPKRLFDALSACPTALDDVTDLYGLKLVSKDAAGVDDLGTLPIASLLALVAEAESPDSPGGTAKTHQELLAMEDSIRAVHLLTANWIEEINRLRGLRAVK